MMMTDVELMSNWCREERKRLRDELQQLEGGTLKVWERRGSPAAATLDATGKIIERIRQSLRQLDTVLAGQSEW